MSIRKIEIKVSNITEPKNTERIWAGIQYEDNATEIVFDVSSVDIAKALYRIDFNSNGAGYHPSKNLNVSGGKISRKIPKSITSYGGEAEAAAVITELDSAGKETGTVYSYPVILYFTPVQKSEYGNETVEGNISEMEESVKIMYEATEKNAAAATNAANSALDSKAKTEEARFSLENGSEFVFMGGNAESSAHIELLSRDFIVEQSILNGWTYRKWSSGICEIWGTRKLVITKDILEYVTHGDAGTVCRVVVPYDFPFTITSSCLDVTCISNGHLLSKPLYIQKSGERTKIFAYLYKEPAEDTTESERTLSFDIQVKGSWK